MIQYEYRGYFLEMSLVGESSSIRVKGTISTHPHITFNDEYIPRLKQQFEAWVDEIYDNTTENSYKYKGIVLDIEEDHYGGWLVGTIKDFPKELVNVKKFCLTAYEVKELKEDFERYVDELERSSSILNHLRGK